MSKPTAISLFAGVGGFDIAAHNAGIEVVAAVEIDSQARGVLAHQFPNTQLFDDVRTVTSEQLLAAGFVPKGGFIFGGFPCQDLSVAGKRAGLGGERSGLFWEIIRLAKQLKPSHLVLENVPGLLSSNGGRDMGTVVGALAECGYSVGWRVLDAQHFGVPQRRRRVFIFASHLGAESVAEILFEFESGARDSAQSQPQGQDFAGTVADSTGAGRSGGIGSDIVGSLCASDYKFPQQQQVMENKVVVQVLSSGKDYANCIPAELYHRNTVVNQDVNSGHLVLRQES